MGAAVQAKNPLAIGQLIAKGHWAAVRRSFVGAQMVLEGGSVVEAHEQGSPRNHALDEEQSAVVGQWVGLGNQPDQRDNPGVVGHSRICVGHGLVLAMWC